MKELKALYELMNELEENMTNDDDFSVAWLGSLVEALGEDWHNVRCRGHWDDLGFDGRILTFYTETAWDACNEVFDLVRRKYPSLHYYYRAEETGTCFYCTNDIEGIYYPERCIVDMRTDEDDWITEYFNDFPSAYKWIEEITGAPLYSEQDFRSLEERWGKVNPNAYININEVEIDME